MVAVNPFTGTFRDEIWNTRFESLFATMHRRGQHQSMRVPRPSARLPAVAAQQEQTPEVACPGLSRGQWFMFIVTVNGAVDDRDTAANLEVR